MCTRRFIATLFAAAALIGAGAPACFAEQRDDGYLAYGRGDYAQALKLWRAQADEGNAAAQYNLALLYDRGDGVPQSFDESLKWTRLAADKGVAAAQLHLGMSYASGRGVKPDPAQAAQWFRRAAEQGDAQSQYNLGAMHEVGRGVPRDIVASHFWFNLAASNFMIGWDRADAIASRDRVARAMTPDQLAEAQRQAQEWKPKPTQVGENR